MPFTVSSYHLWPCPFEYKNCTRTSCVAQRRISGYWTYIQDLWCMAGGSIS